MHDSIPAEHAQHDLELIAGHAAGDLADTQRSRADALIQSCASCADLRRDLVALAAATRMLPASAAPRDFRLTAAQAARLRRGGWRKALLRPFAAPRSTIRPMAMAFTSLGLAGLLVTTILPSLFLFGSAGSAAPGAAGPQPAASSASAGDVAGAPYGQPSASDSTVRFGPQSRPSPVVVSGGVGGSKSSGSGTTAPDVAAQQAQLDRLRATRESEQLAASAPEPSPIVIGSLVLLAVGLALFGLRFLARRAV